MITPNNGQQPPTEEELSNLSEAERAAIATAYLRGIEPAGKLHYDLFVELARLVVLSTVEIVPLRDSPEKSDVEVLLTQRPETDRWWAGQWHVPGTVIFPLDQVAKDEEINFEGAFEPVSSYLGPIERVIDGELQNSVAITNGPHLLEARYRAGLRGHESTVMCWAEVSETGSPLVGQFFGSREISESYPEEGLIVGHRGLVDRGVEAYKAYKQTTS